MNETECYSHIIKPHETHSKIRNIFPESVGEEHFLNLYLFILHFIW